MVKARLKIEPSGTLFDFSKEYPDTEFKILISWPTDAGMYSIVEIEMEEPTVVLPYFDAATEIESYEILHADDQLALIQFLMPAPAPYRAGQESENLPHFPIVIRDGWIINETIGTPERISALKEELDAAGIRYEVISITQSHDPEEVLTDRQRQVVSEAVTRGYYDTPRTCSLTELAELLDINKATASGILHRAEETIIKEFTGNSAEETETV